MYTEIIQSTTIASVKILKKLRPYSCQNNEQLIKKAQSCIDYITL